MTNATLKSIVKNITKNLYTNNDFRQKDRMVFDLDDKLNKCDLSKISKYTVILDMKFMSIELDEETIDVTYTLLYDIMQNAIFIEKAYSSSNLLLADLAMSVKERYTLYRWALKPNDVEIIMFDTKRVSNIKKSKTHNRMFREAIQQFIA